MDSKQIVEHYLEAWQKGDAKALRALLADKGRYGKGQVAADQITREIMSYPAWKNMKMINAVYGPSDAAIMYEGDDPKTGQRLRSAEFMSIAGGKIENLNGVFSSAPGAALTLMVSDAI